MAQSISLSNILNKMAYQQLNTKTLYIEMKN